MGVRDPVLTLSLLAACALVATLLWWLAQPAAERELRLRIIAQVERARLHPPQALMAQAHWLLRHRLEVLYRCATAVLGAMGIGLIEGLDRRRHIPLRGMQYLPWVLGKLGVVITLALVCGFGVMPWAWPFARVVALASLGSACTVYVLVVGFPRLR